MIYNNEKTGTIQDAASVAFGALMIAVLSGFFMAIPAKVVWNLYAVQWLDPISYWQAFCIVLVFKLITSPLKRG